MWFRVSTKSEHQSFEVDLEKWTKCDRFSSSVLPFIFMPANHLITILATEKSWFLYIFFLLTTLIPTLSYKEVTTWNLCELILICGKELPFNFGIQTFYGQFKQLMGAVHNGLPWLKPHVYLLLSLSFSGDSVVHSSQRWPPSSWGRWEQGEKDRWHPCMGSGVPQSGPRHLVWTHSGKHTWIILHFLWIELQLTGVSKTLPYT